MEKTQWWCGPGRLAFLGAAVSILVVLVIVPAARADEIAYECGGDICTIDPDNTVTHADLTETPLNDDFEPAWSPDGTRIAFNGLYGRRDRVYTISPTDPAAGATEVIDGEFAGGDPVWSPDGTKIAFFGESELVGGDTNVYVSPADGTSAPQAIGATAAEEREPTWSPDGSLLAFARGVATWISAPAESATPHVLANGLGAEPAWSPDGRRIAMITVGEPHRVRLVDADGDEGAEELPVHAEFRSSAAPSPGRRIRARSSTSTKTITSGSPRPILRAPGSRSRCPRT